MVVSRKALVQERSGLYERYLKRERRKGCGI
jgi:hypothetical protein